MLEFLDPGYHSWINKMKGLGALGLEFIAGLILVGDELAHDYLPGVKLWNWDPRKLIQGTWRSEKNLEPKIYNILQILGNSYLLFSHWSGQVVDSLSFFRWKGNAPADEWIRKLWYIYTMEYYSAIKKNTFESVLMRWMKLEPIIQSEVSQKEKCQYSILTHIYGI